jgi:hypothetical protein
MQTKKQKLSKRSFQHEIISLKSIDLPKLNVIVDLTYELNKKRKQLHTDGFHNSEFFIWLLGRLVQEII